MSSIIKNNNPDWHCLNKENICRICKCVKTHSYAFVKHYERFHPHSEVFPSRLSPDAASLLRSIEIHQLEVVKPGKYRKFEQICYFCYEKKCYRKDDWIKHVIGHTGHFELESTDCLGKVANNSLVSEGKVRKAPKFEAPYVMAFLCDLCNFVRFNKSEIEKHLRNEHEGDVKDQFKEVVFLRFPKIMQRGKKRIEPKSEFVCYCNVLMC